jgi:hypothetical protein
MRFNGEFSMKQEKQMRVSRGLGGREARIRPIGANSVWGKGTTGGAKARVGIGVSKYSTNVLVSQVQNGNCCENVILLGNCLRGRN